MANISNKNINLIFMILIVLLTALASYPSVMEYESMYLDDMGRYDLALKNTIHPIRLTSVTIHIPSFYAV